MKQIASAITMMVIFTIACFFLNQTFDSSSELVVLSNEVMEEISGGQTSSFTDKVTRGIERYRPTAAASSAIARCVSPDDCTKGTKTAWPLRYSCRRCNRGEHRYSKVDMALKIVTYCRDRTTTCKLVVNEYGKEKCCVTRLSPTCS